MHWKLVTKDPVRQPKKGSYNDWKEQIAEECFHQCVYCSIHESPWGGIDHYHIDHFRPKSKPKFKHLENDICNLFYSCPICNRFKSDDWPGEPTNLDVICYPDPSKIDYSTIFNLNQENYSISSSYKSGCYLIHRLFLNRPQLIYERRESILKQKEARLFEEISQMLQKCEDNSILKKSILIMNEVRQHLLDRDKIRPYKLSEIKKP